ncbi:MAG: hypothetical protein WAM82_20335, partial [Thermoanaerobaculia bacterium]
PETPRASAPADRPAPRPETAAPAPTATTTSATVGRPSDPVTVFKEEAAKRKPNLGGFLDALDDIQFEDGKVLLLAPSGDNYLRSRLEANRSILEEAAAVAWGAGTRVEIREGRSAPPVAAAKLVRAPEIEPAVQAVLEIFQGSRIEAVEEQGTYTEE